MSEPLCVIVQAGQKISEAMPREQAQAEVDRRNQKLVESNDQSPRFDIKEVLLG